MTKPSPDAPLGSEFHARWKVLFRQFAALHDDDAGIAGWSASGLAARLRLFRRRWVEQPAGSFWLDIGCGAGTYTRFLEQQAVRVLGIDYSLPSLVKAKARSSPAIGWVAGDVMALPIREASCDGILCLGVLQAIPASEPALAAMAAAMKPGATLWVDALNARCIPNRLTIRARRRAGKPVHLRYETVESLRRSAKTAGLEVVAVHWAPILPARLQRVQPLVESAAFRCLLVRVPTLAALVSHSMLFELRKPGRVP